ncbi:hypothetical protein A2619_01920 [candidate division WWE3 bacterium RIFOXYD1_FULL_39_9]|uniref:Uncharacterized protein n=1 Tax=candidate division WWE3 bacterium RIFOXYD1_FULL_39_9 TaxID=1802649 RepID=A0A1F4X7K7_UNCKA|nr:MAG: hypothetical protein A2619_01920 [candidate division WWE3 bacterium RIFOXYD1_FULL_39_9]
MKNIWEGVLARLADGKPVISITWFLLIVSATALATYLAFTLRFGTGLEKAVVVENQPITETLVEAGESSPEVDPTQHFMMVRDFENYKTSRYLMSSGASEDINEISSLPAPTNLDDLVADMPYYTFVDASMDEIDTPYDWIWAESTGYNWASPGLNANWEIESAAAGEIYDISVSQITDSFQLSWVKDSEMFVEQVPYGNIIKVSTCDEADGINSSAAVYIQVLEEEIRFLRPQGEPLFSAHAITCNGDRDYLIWDTYTRIPFAVVDKAGMVEYFWHQPLSCQGTDWEYGLCWSFDTDIAR